MNILTVLSNVLAPMSLLWMNIGLAAGIIIGALPGLTGTMGIALLLPLTYGMSSIHGMMLLLGVYCGGIYGGSITAILINTPGTPASAATSLDGYPMAQQGHAKRALHDALAASMIGGLISCVILLTCAPMVAKFALNFGAREYFALSLFGNNYLTGGFNIIPVLIGLFAITEIMTKSRDINKAVGTTVAVEEEKVSFKDVLGYKMVLLKSSIIGAFIGAVPGTGAAIASFLAYNEAHRTSKHPEEYGKGSEEGLVACESSNNAVTGATMIPLLTLGIPGDTNTAVLLGALTMQGIQPGPMLFTKQGDWVYSIMIGMALINVFMYLQGRLFVKGFSNITKISTKIMVPCLVVLCVIGAYAIKYNTFNAVAMVVIGVVGYLLKKLDFPLTPMVIGLVLGNLCESNMRRALLLSRGNWMTFFQSPIACVFLALAVFMLFFPMIRDALTAKKKKA